MSPKDMYLLWNPVIGSNAMAQCHFKSYKILSIGRGVVRLPRRSSGHPYTFPDEINQIKKGGDSITVKT
jgi:hypothetical protein